MSTKILFLFHEMLGGGGGCGGGGGGGGKRAIFEIANISFKLLDCVFYSREKAFEETW